MSNRILMSPLVALVLLAACTKSEERTAPPPTPVAVPSTPPVPATADVPKMAAGEVTPHGRLGTAPERLGLALGASLPDVTLNDIEGKPTRLGQVTGGGAVLVVFYRGGWCPFCNSQVKQMADASPEFQRRGVTPVLVSADKAQENAKTRAVYEVKFPLLGDAELVAHEAFHVVHQADDAEVARLKGFGIDIEASSGKTHHKFAVPSMFLFGADGKLLWRHVDLDYKTRPSILQVLEIIDAKVDPAK